MGDYPPAVLGAIDQSMSERTSVSSAETSPVRDTAWLDAHLCNWAAGIGIFLGRRDRLYASQFGRLAALAHPRADDQRLLLAARLVAALFAIDDHYCDDIAAGADPARLGSRLALALSAMERPPLPQPYSRLLETALDREPCLVALKDVMCSLAEIATPVQAARVRREIMVMLLGMVGEAGWRTEGRTPSPWEYFANRQWNGGLPNLAMIDVVNGYELPEEYFESPRLRLVTLMVSNLLMLVNDLYSRPKEDGSELPAFNLPSVLAYAHEWTLSESAQETADIHNEMIAAYLDAEREARNGAGSVALRYLDDLRQWVSGSLEWHRTSGRYQTPDGVPPHAAPLATVFKESAQSVSLR